MESGTLAIPIAFVFILTLLLIILIKVRGKWLLKAALTVALIPLTFGVWEAIDTYRGWAAIGQVPDEFQVIWMDIREPNPAANDKGAIFIWLRAFDPPGKDSSGNPLQYQPKQQEPRTYRLPYTRELHENAAKALERIKQGLPVMGKRQGGNADVGEPGQEGQPGEAGETGNRQRGDGVANQTGRGGGGYSRETDIMFYDLPPPRMPEKEPPR